MDTKPYELYISIEKLKSLWKCETNWQNELFLRATLVAFELSFLLIHDTAKDIRSTVRQEERISRLFSGCNQQIQLLAEILETTEPLVNIFSDEQSTKTNFTKLIGLDENISKKLKQWTGLYRILLEDISFNFGIEDYINQFKTQNIVDHQKPNIPYDEWIKPDTIAHLFDQRNFNPEDKLFVVVHQVTECWLCISLSLLKTSQFATQEGNWQTATNKISKVCSILNYLAQHILILETMVLADYHELRVKLRDASGAQSKQSLDIVNLAKALFLPVTEYLKEHNCSLIDIYDAPNQHVNLYQYIEVLSCLETRLTNFFFCHYKLATQILGSESLGSLGFEVQALIKRFVQPIYLDLDKVRYQYVVITNFKYGQYAGNIISSLENEDLVIKKDEVIEVSRQTIENTINNFIQSVREHDIDKLISLFELDGFIEDPFGSRAFKGTSGLKVYFRGFMKIFASDIQIKNRNIFLVSNQGEVEFHWEIQTTHKDVPINFSGLDKIQFSETGKIKSIQVFYDPTVISQQLLTTFRGLNKKMSK
ncbi:tryptophan 2,3-dioxygenase family protein [Nodularia harveyana UHCC-0300]|uniref:Tryptophan 2,3-dioxygenase family protein n=1 Tax=Nodularia harveyana UHCC-0300 TaxID=2974287 RepID=A0ABU5UD33_9CYAN|nr:tryptophan 2,3-dioxygenase family protein [Nodularia harveyana]MEA5580911.1 tryptophan 2,3-dioxygenase family protein [Nodularia harveyana UHCC-0300]